MFDARVTRGRQPEPARAARLRTTERLQRIRKFCAGGHSHFACSGARPPGRSRRARAGDCSLALAVSLDPSPGADARIADEMEPSARLRVRLGTSEPGRLGLEV